MDEADSAEIAHIEARIEQLHEAIARCRKLSLTAKLTIGAGAAWIVLTLTWIVPYEAAVLFASIAAVIGGVVLLGSNATTWTQTEAALDAAEAMRAEWIGQRQMRVVEDSRTVH